MDTRLLTILKEVAYGELAYDDQASWCLYGECTAGDTYPKYSLAVHTCDCPVTYARQLLSEAGTPALLYRIEWEYFDRRTNEWVQASTSYRIAYSEDEVRPLFPEHTDFSVKGIPRRNVRILCLGEAQDLLK
jgi:hypothetical protein